MILTFEISTTSNNYRYFYFSLQEASGQSVWGANQQIFTVTGYYKVSIVEKNHPLKAFHSGMVASISPNLIQPTFYTSYPNFAFQWKNRLYHFLSCSLPYGIEGEGEAVANCSKHDFPLILITFDFNWWHLITVDMPMNPQAQLNLCSSCGSWVLLQIVFKRKFFIKRSSSQSITIYQAAVLKIYALYYTDV